MSQHLKLTLLLLTTGVSAFLPAPYNVEMIAVDLDYMLQWDWNHTQLKDPVTFTAEYRFWEDNDGLYTRVCEGCTENRCDFTHCNLEFSGDYEIRVRAKAGLQHSNWTSKRFTPDEDVVLSTPTMNVTGDVDVLTVTIAKSVMSDVMNLHYSVQYWESRKPEQKHVLDYASPHVPLSSLKSCTEYCVQVSVYYDNKNSNYTPPHCVYMTGCHLLWSKILPVLCIIPLITLVAAFLYTHYKTRRKTSTYTIPENLQAIPSFPLLLEVQEECWTVADVISTQPTDTPNDEQEHTPERQDPVPVNNCRSASVQKSGFSSGLDS